jgi:toxic protein SymE
MGGNPNDPLTTTNSNEELIMAKADDKAVNDVSVRILTVARKHQRWQVPVCYPPHLDYKPDGPDVPWIRLSGQWLERAGFAISSKARVEVSQGKLVITPA